MLDDLTRIAEAQHPDVDHWSVRWSRSRTRSWVVRRGVASLNTWLENICLVLTARGQPFDQGVVLDAWRYGGRLHWCDVKEDKKYPWVEAGVVDQGAASPPVATKGAIENPFGLTPP